MTTYWSHQHIRKGNRRAFGGRWQDRVPLRFPDPKQGETVRQYIKRVGYGTNIMDRVRFVQMCKREGGDRIWQDRTDWFAWCCEIGEPPPHLIFGYWKPSEKATRL